MAVVDPIADMLAQVRNAHMALHNMVNVPKSKMKSAIAEILKEEGYIDDFEEDEKAIRIKLKYTGGRPLISGLKRISRPGRRVYVGAGEIPMVQNGLGICILSTSRGVMEGGRARQENMGGELLCEVW